MLVDLIKSITVPIVDASAVSFTSVIASFTTGGSTAFIVCGRMMSFIVANFDIPSASAASYCPSSTLAIPPL